MFYLLLKCYFIVKIIILLLKCYFLSYSVIKRGAIFIDINS